MVVTVRVVSVLRHSLIAVTLTWPVAAPRTQAQRKPVRRELTISSETFRPSSVAVQLGDSVIWRNTDIVRHTSTSRKTVWDSGKLKSGARFVWVANQMGIFEYYCSTHKGMKGTLTVR